jgi:hypothetical protein
MGWPPGGPWCDPVVEVKGQKRVIFLFFLIKKKCFFGDSTIVFV